MVDFTKGPWSYGIDDDGWAASVWHGDCYKVHIADVGPSEKSKEEITANARLIAAAPDLQRELQRLVRCLRPWIEGGHRVPGIATLNGADEALRKALHGSNAE